MPENTEQETARVGSGNRSNMTINRELQANKTRIGSAKYYDIASALMGKGKADLEELFLNAARDGDYDRIETFLLRRSDVLVSIDVKDKRTGNTPLIWAATRGHTKIVQLLLKHGADITLRNYENQTAVEVASPTIRTLLLDSVERTTETSHRLLLQAAWQGNIKVLRKLLSENKVRDINCQNSEGLTALLLCCRDILIFERMSTQLNRPYNPVECVQELLAHRANVHAVDGDEMTCLHYVSKSKAAHAQAIIQTIITAGPNIESKDKRLFAPIHCASQSGNVECIEALLDGGSDVNSRGFAGATPLHITAYNDHEKAACTLLKHGANVTLTDDRGLTALDLARGRKMKVVLKEAWTEATQNKPSTNLAPLKTPGREDSRLSIDETKKKKGGEVIFDGLPSNPFSNMKSTPSKGKLVSRHLSLREKARRAEESMMTDIENGNFTPSPYINTCIDIDKTSSSKSPSRDGVRRLGQVRGQRVSPSPLPKSRSGERLPALSPDLSFDRDSPAFNRNGKYRRSFEEGKSNLGNKTVTHPAPGGRSNRVSPLTVRDPNRASPLTIVDTDVDQCMQINRMQAPSPTPSYSKGYKRHHRSGSDTAANIANITSTCDTLINNKGRAAPLSYSEDFSDRASSRGTKFPRRDSTLYNTLSRETTQKSLYNQEGQTSQTTCELTKILDLDRMGLTNRCPQTPVQGVPLYPTSSKILPPTPTFYNQKTSSHLASGMIEQKSDDSKDPSPRSDDEDVVKNPEVKMAFSGTLELLRSRSIYKDEFVLEESRPRDLSLRSSSSEDSQGSKQSFSSGSSNNNQPINQIKKPDMAKAEETKKTDKPSSSFAKKSVTQNKQKASVGNSVTFSNKDANTLNNISVSTVPCSTGNVPSSGGVRNPSVVKNKITIHSQQLIDTENKSAENKNTQNKTKSSAMQVVSSKLLSNVKEEIQKRTELLKDVEECVVTETSKEETNTEDEKIAKEKLTKSMSDLKSGEKEPVLQRPATQASTKTINRVGPPVQVKTSVKSKVILASSNQNNRNTTPSYLQPTRSSALRKSNSQDSNVVTKSQNKNSNTKVQMEVKQINADKTLQETADNKEESNSESNMKDTVNAQNSSCSVPLEINTGDISDQNDETTGLVDSSGLTGKVTLTTNSPGATKTVGPKSGKPVSSGSVSHIVATHSSSSPQSARTVTNSANNQSAQKSASSGRVSVGIISRGNSGFSSRGNSGINSRGNSGITTRGNSGITSRGNSGINSRGASGLMSRGNSGVNARGNSGTGVKKSQSDSSIAENHQINSKITEEQSKIDHDSESQNGKLKSSSMSTINEAMEKNVTKPQSENITINTSAESNHVVPNFQYKPASAGKPPLVEIVTSNTPRRPKPEPVVKGPVQTPVIEDPFAEMYEDKGISAVDVKTNGRGVSATQYGYVVTKPTIEKSKTNISIKSRGKSAKKKDLKPSSANPKQVGKRRAGVKSKENKNTDDAIVRPKSGKKRCRSGKRRKKTPVESALSRQATQPDVALISGIGWHLAASCIDTSDVTAVKCRESSTSSDESDDNLDEPTPRPPPFMFDDLELITSQNYDMHIETPREFHPQPKHSKNLHLEIYKNIDSVPTTPSPRFRQVKPEFSNHDDLPKVDNDGYRPMNLDLTQSSLPKKDSDESEVSGLNSLPDVNMLFKINHAEATQKELDDILNSDPEVNETNEAVYRQILIDKLTPIPESPSLSATTPLHKTLDALKLFDANVKEDTLNALLGLNSQTPRVPNDLNHSKNSARISNSVKNESEDKKIGNSLRNSVNVSGNKRRGSLDGSKSSSQQSSAGSTRNQEQGDRSGAGNKSFNLSVGNKSNNSSARNKTNNSSAGNKSQRSLGLKSQQSSAANRSRLSEAEAIKKSTSVHTSDGSEKNKTQELSNSDKKVDNSYPAKQENQSEELQLSIENLKAAIQQNKLKKSKKRDKMIDKDVPLLDLKPLIESGGNSDEGQSSRRRKDSTGRTSRRERRFSETKSDHEHEENIDEVVDEILSNTTSSVRSNKTLTNVSRNSTLTEADKQLLLKMTSSDSPFHAKFSASVSDDRQNENVHPVEEITVQHPTDPNLLQVYQKDKAQVGKKLRSSVDSEAITKVMNSFKHMELYAGGSLKLALKGSREHLHKEHIHRPHVSMGEPSSLAFRKPPVALPSKVKAVGKFTEIRSSKQENSSMRNSTQKEESHKFSHHAAEAPNFPDSVGIDEELAQALRANSPDNVTINSDISLYTRDLDSRADSACTTDSCQSYSDETIQWKKGNVLGKGAFGTVWCGLTSEGQLIAVKQIELNTNDKDKAKREYEKVQEEVELLKLLNHKNIVGYLGTSLEEEDSLVSIFMQFVPGGSIASILARFGALDEAVFRRYTKQILEGVAYLHSNDVIHRDIKGGNVMLMPNGIIKLIDFGCAKRLCINLSMGQSQILKSMKGTPYWMAPEVVNETGHGKKSDIWSVGCTVFEMATRKPPWADMNPMAAIFAIGSDRTVPKLPDKFSPEAVEFVDACLTRDQSKRPSATQLLQYNFIMKRKNSKR